MDSDTARPEAKVAAKWWADQLRRPTKTDTGAPYVDITMSAYYAIRWHPLDGATIDIFQDALETAIEEYLATKAWDPAAPWKDNRVIGVDYEPDVVLSAACIAAGIDDMDARLPKKTKLWIDPGEVSVALGYGAQPEVIWTKDRPNGQ